MKLNEEVKSQEKQSSSPFTNPWAHPSIEWNLNHLIWGFRVVKDLDKKFKIYQKQDAE